MQRCHYLDNVSRYKSYVTAGAGDTDWTWGWSADARLDFSALPERTHCLMSWTRDTWATRNSELLVDGLLGAAVDLIATQFDINANSVAKCLLLSLILRCKFTCNVIVISLYDAVAEKQLLNIIFTWNIFFIHEIQTWDNITSLSFYIRCYNLSVWTFQS